VAELPPDMTFWEDVLHRRSCRDAGRMTLIEERLAVLETPWWRPFRRRRRVRAYVAFSKAYDLRASDEREGRAGSPEVPS